MAERTEFSSSRKAKAHIREVYGRYVLGKDRFPRERLAAPIEEVNPNVRPYANLLNRAWDHIDSDENYFWTMVREAGERALAAEDPSKTGYLVVATSGLNAVNFSRTKLGEDGRPETTYITVDAPDAEGLANRLGMRAADGNAISYRNGELVVPPYPDAVVLRPGAAASYFGPPIQAVA